MLRVGVTIFSLCSDFIIHAKETIRIRLFLPKGELLSLVGYPFYTNLTFACKTETLDSLYSHALLIPLGHALLIPLKSSKSKF